GGELARVLTHRFDLDRRHAICRDQPDIDIAVARAEAAMGEAADEVEAEQAPAELFLPIGGNAARETARLFGCCVVVAVHLVRCPALVIVPLRSSPTRRDRPSAPSRRRVC